VEFDKHEKLVIISKITEDKMKIESFNVILTNEISITMISICNPNKSFLTTPQPFLNPQYT